MEVHRLINELDLDWIFNCINRGTIDNMVGGSVTHTHTHKLPLEINKQNMLYSGRKAEARTRVRCTTLAISILSYG